MRTKKERRADFLKSEVLEAASSLFKTNGIAGTTVDDIAKKSEYSKVTIYAYFKSKDDILNHLILEGMIYFRERVAALAAEKLGFKDFFTKLHRLIVELHELQPVYFKGLAGAIPVSGKIFEDDATLRDIYRIGEEIHDIVLARLEQGKKEGFIKRPDLGVSAVLALWFSLCGMIEAASAKEEYIRLRTGFERDQFLEEGAQLLLRSLIS